MDVTIPTCFEANLALGDGSAGASLSDVLQFTCNEVANLYSSSADRFTYCFQVWPWIVGSSVVEMAFSAPTGTWSGLR